MTLIHWKMVAFVSMSILVTSCATSKNKNPTQMASNLINRQSVTTLTHQTYPKKRPEQVALYTNKSAPHFAYRIIGVTSVAKHNVFGLPRQNETLNSMMKQLAASIGGDGIIDVEHTGNTVQAKVIAYERILI